MQAEHLMAIAPETGRGKDYARLVSFVEASVAKPASLRDILKRHGLSPARKTFEERYLSQP